MSAVTYTIVEHDGGWAYRLGDVYSEAYPTHDAALAAARAAAEKQGLPGPEEDIEYQDSEGHWRTEHVTDDDRPEAEVED